MTDELQFDRVVPQAAAVAAPVMPAVTCAACRTTIQTEYYQINGNAFCNPCRTLVESSAETPRGLGLFLTAALFGLGAGVVGAAIYYAVIAFAHLEIGLIAILIGYMVGYSVRRGAGGRGGLRFQILAVALTYASVAFAYTPLVLTQAFNANGKATQSVMGAPVAPAPPKPSAVKLILSFSALLAFIVSLPVAVVFGAFPTGLISAVIIFIGMRQAWKMTGAPRFDVLGPYRVGATPVSSPA